MIVDDDLDQYGPPLRASGPIMAGQTVMVDTDGGIVARVSLNGRAPEPEPDGGEPTRYAQHLRRQAANRARRARDLPTLPMIGPGSCEACEGWGVRGERRERCPHCDGRGAAR